MRCQGVCVDRTRLGAAWRTWRSRLLTRANRDARLPLLHAYLRGPGVMLCQPKPKRDLQERDAPFTKHTLTRSLALRRMLTARTYDRRYRRGIVGLQTSYKV